MTTGNMLDLFDQVFKCNIGDIVALRRHVESFAAEGDINDGKRSYAGLIGPPPSMQIVARIMEQCDGGIQTFYTCRYTGGEHNDKIITQNFHGFELVPYSAAVKTAKAAFPNKGR